MAEFAIARATFSDELSKLTSVVKDKKPTIPILGFIRIEAIGQNLKLTATNMEETIYSTVSSNQLAVASEGVMCVPAKRILEAVRLMPDGPIKITSDTNDWIKIIAPGCSQRIPGGKPDSFPATPNYDGVTWIDLPAKKFKAMLEGTRHAISTNVALHHLRGTKLEIDANGIRIVTTDGTRLALSEVPVGESFYIQASTQQASIDKFEVFIPVEGVDEVLKLIPDNLDTVGICLTDHLFFKLGDKVLSTRLLTTKFVSYRLPFSTLGTYEHFTTFPADDLVKPIKRAMLSADEKDNGIAVSFGNGDLSINAASADLGEATENLKSDFNGLPIKIYFNGKLLLDYLEGLGTQPVRMEIKDSKSQCYLIAQHKEVDHFLCLMPLASKD